MGSGTIPGEAEGEDLQGCGAELRRPRLQPSSSTAAVMKGLRDARMDLGAPGRQEESSRRQRGRGPPRAGELKIQQKTSHQL